MVRRAHVEDGTSRERGELEVTECAQGDLFDPACPTRQLLDRLGTKWISMVVTVLSDAGDEVRFSELRRRVPGISQKMLSHTLSGLVADGLVQRRVQGSVPPAVHYRLSSLGVSLVGPLVVLRQWAESHMHEIDLHRQGLGRESA